MIFKSVQLSRKPSTSAWLHRAGKPIFDMTVILKTQIRLLGTADEKTCRKGKSAMCVVRPDGR